MQAFIIELHLLARVVPENSTESKSFSGEAGAMRGVFVGHTEPKEQREESRTRSDYPES